MIDINELQYELSIEIAKKELSELKEKNAFKNECNELGIKRLE